LRQNYENIIKSRGQVVIPKKIREAVHVEKGDEFEIEVVGETIVLKPIKRFKAQKWQDYIQKWQDYIGIGEGIVDSYLKEKHEHGDEKEDIANIKKCEQFLKEGYSREKNLEEWETTAGAGLE